MKFDAAQRMHVVCGAVFLCCAGMAVVPALSQSTGEASSGAAKAAPCLSCHGSPARSPLTATPSLDGQTAPFLELQMVLMREGLREVPQMAGMLKGWSDRELTAVAAYFAGQKPPAHGAGRDAKLHARGAALAREMICGNCHGEDYRGQKHVPRLANQREDYLVLSLKSYRDNKRTGIDTSMNGVMHRIPDSDIEALAHYLAYR